MTVLQMEGCPLWQPVPNPVMTEHTPPKTILDTVYPHFGQYLTTKAQRHKEQPVFTTECLARHSRNQKIHLNHEKWRIIYPQMDTDGRR
jgi:hypothetical protein